MNITKWVVLPAAVVWGMLGQATQSLAQRPVNGRFLPFTPYSSVSLGAGSSTYLGDLAAYNQPFRSLTTLPRWNVGLAYTRHVTPNVAVRASFTWARIVGDDYTYTRSDPTRLAAAYARNLHVRNDIKEVAITSIYNFVADGRTPNRRPTFTPYVFGGLAVAAHNPEARTPTTTNGNNGDSDARKWVKLQPLHTEGQGQANRAKPYSLLTVAVPVGFGVRYRLNEQFNIGFEVGFRYTFSDYLDDVAGSYAQVDALQGLPRLLADRRFEYDAARVNTNRYTVAQQLLQTDIAQFTTDVRGSSKSLNDSYLLTSLSIQYIFPVSIKCPPMR